MADVVDSLHNRRNSRPSRSPMDAGEIEMQQSSE